MRGSIEAVIVGSVLTLAQTAGGQSTGVDMSTFTPIPVPWQNTNSFTIPTFISDAGDVGGWYESNHPPAHGFVKVRDCTQGQDPRLTSICGRFFAFDAPMPSNYTGDTEILGIDGFGNVLGSYYDGSYHIGLWYPQCSAVTCTLEFHRFDDPKVPAGAQGTYPIGISQDGTVTGLYYPVAGDYGTRSFVAHPDRGNGTISPETTKLTFSDLAAPGFPTTSAAAISPNGLIAGAVSKVSTVFNASEYGGFLRTQDGHVTVADVQNMFYPYIVGVNSYGMVAGYTWDPFHGFVSTSIGTVTWLNNPLDPTGINDKGVVVGNAQYSGFIRTPDGKVYELNAPGTTPSSASGTYVAAINSSGWIVGIALGGSSASQLFVWKPL